MRDARSNRKVVRHNAMPGTPRRDAMFAMVVGKELAGGLPARLQGVYIVGALFGCAAK